MTLVLSNQDFNSSSRILNLPAPVGATEPVRLQDLTSAVEGISWKDSCRAGSVGNINIASPGATIDGVSLVIGDRVLLLSQTLADQNGIYNWNGAAVALTRSLDCSTSEELEAATTMIEEGATNAGVSYRQTSVGFVLGVGAVNWVSFGTNAPVSSTTVSGIIRTATQAEVDAGIVVNAAISPGTLLNYAGRVKKFATAIGDGSATTFTVTHNLNSLDVGIDVYRVTGGISVIADVARTSVNAAQITFATAPAIGAYRVVVVG